MPKKSDRVVLTLLGSAALSVGCQRTAPPPPPAPAPVTKTDPLDDPLMSQIDFEKGPNEHEQEPGAGTGVAGQTAVAPTSTSNHYTGHSTHSSHYYRGHSSMWPMLLWYGGMNRGYSSTPTRPYSGASSSTVPRGPSSVTPPPIPPHSTGSHTAGSHTTGSHSTHTTPPPIPSSAKKSTGSSWFGGSSSHGTTAGTHGTTSHSSSPSRVSTGGFGSSSHSISSGS